MRVQLRFVGVEREAGVVCHAVRCSCEARCRDRIAVGGRDRGEAEEGIRDPCLERKPDRGPKRSLEAPLRLGTFTACQERKPSVEQGHRRPTEARPDALGKLDRLLRRLEGPLVIPPRERCSRNVDKQQEQPTVVGGLGARQCERVVEELRRTVVVTEHGAVDRHLIERPDGELASQVPCQPERFFGRSNPAVVLAAHVRVPG